MLKSILPTNELLPGIHMDFHFGHILAYVVTYRLWYRVEIRPCKCSLSVGAMFIASYSVYDLVLVVKIETGTVR